MLAACSSTNVEDIAPRGQSVSTASRPAGSVAPPTNDYPNLNIATTPAAAQITAEERQQIINELTAKRGTGAGSGTAGMSEAERLKLLARQRQDETLSAIETAQ